MLKPPPDFGAEGSVWHGLNALAAGDRRMATAWFGRASRLAPDDSHARLLLASSLMGEDDQAALKLFLQIVEEDDLREAHFGIVSIRLRHGESAAAAAGLDMMLQRLSPLVDAGFATMATAVAQAVGAPGWIGLRPDGTLLVGITHDVRSDLVVRVGRRRVPLPNVPFNPETPFIVALPHGWAASGAITGATAKAPLLGSPICPALFRRAIGFVEAHAGGLRGWAVLPACPGSELELTVVANTAGRKRRSLRLWASAPLPPVGAPRGAWGFALPRHALPGEGPVSVLAPNGASLTGSPVDPGAEMRAAASAAAALRTIKLGSTSRQATSGRRGVHLGLPQECAQLDPWRPLPAGLPLPLRPPRRAHDRARETKVVIIIPIYRGAEEFAACLASVLAHLPACARIVVVDDASPDAALRDIAQAAAERGQIELLRLDQNLGFPGAANAGLRRALGQDAILLNSDTLVPPGWIERLRARAWSASDIGSVTPLSNDATILSYPDSRGENPIPDADMTLQLDLACQAANPDGLADIPTGVGFCMFLRHDCLREVGLLREDVFAQGYGEENDWCLRARRLGWRHIAMLDLFVAHVGGRSFGLSKAALTKRNGRILDRLHPGYDALIQGFLADDPLASARRRVDEVRWAQNSLPAGAIVMISHGQGGGVDRHVRERSVAIAALGLRPVLIEPERGRENNERNEPDSLCCTLSDGRAGSGDWRYPNLRFTLPDEIDTLVALLRAEQVRRVEIHHLLGHVPEITRLPELLGVPMTVHIHDYAWLCPRISLLGRDEYHCSEPASDVCDECVDDLGVPGMMQRDAIALRRQSAAIFGQAERVIASCQDSADRIRRHFPEVVPEIRPWEVPAHSPHPPPKALLNPRGDTATVAILGAIGPEKGYKVLLGCARDAAFRKLPLRFVLVGYSSDDDRLIRTGKVFVTGRFAKGQATELLREHGAELGFVPSVVPETWCYALSELRYAGLRVAAFDIGAQSERLRADGDGYLLPLGTAVAAVNDALLHHLRPGVQAEIRVPSGSQSALREA